MRDENRTGKPTAGPSRVKGKGRSAEKPLNVEQESLFLRDLELVIIAGDLGDPQVGYA